MDRKTKSFVRNEMKKLQKSMEIYGIYLSLHSNVALTFYSFGVLPGDVIIDCWAARDEKSAGMSNNQLVDSCL